MSVFLSAQPDPETVAATTAALGRETIRRALMLEMQFASGTIYVSDWNVPFVDLRWGHTWVGMGDLVGMADVAGGPDDLAPYREYHLGLPHEMLTGGEVGINGMGRIPALIGNQAEFVDRAAILYMQLFDLEALDGAGRALPVGYPFALDYSTMDHVSASWAPEGATLTLRVEGLMARKGAPNYGLLTHRDQLRRHPGDTGLEFVPEVASTSPVWKTW